MFCEFEVILLLKVEDMRGSLLRNSQLRWTGGLEQGQRLS